MSFLLRKLPYKTLNPRHILTTRFLTTQNYNPNPEEHTSAYFDDLVNVAGRSRDFDTLRHLLNKRVKLSCFNTTNTFKFIADTEDSLSVIDQLCKTLSRLDKGFPRKNAFDALIARLCKLSKIEEALRMVDIMVRGEYGINALSLHPIFSVLTRKRRMEEAWRLVDLMREIRVPIDVTAYNYLLTAYAVARDLSSASDVLTRMEEEGFRADSRTYDALVLGACRAGKVDAALAVLRRMVDDGAAVLYSTHGHVISSLLELGYYAQAVQFVICYGGRNMGLDTENFRCLAKGMIKLERFEEAKMVLEEMCNRDLVMGDKLRDYYETNVKN